MRRPARATRLVHSHRPARHRKRAQMRTSMPRDRDTLPPSAPDGRSGCGSRPAPGQPRLHGRRQRKLDELRLPWCGTSSSSLRSAPWRGPAQLLLGARCRRSAAGGPPPWTPAARRTARWAGRRPARRRSDAGTRNRRRPSASAGRPRRPALDGAAPRSNGCIGSSERARRPAAHRAVPRRRRRGRCRGGSAPDASMRVSPSARSSGSSTRSPASLSLAPVDRAGVVSSRWSRCAPAPRLPADVSDDELDGRPSAGRGVGGSSIGTASGRRSRPAASGSSVTSSRRGSSACLGPDRRGRDAPHRHRSRTASSQPSQASVEPRPRPATAEDQACRAGRAA